jgi:hypothetical protein
MNSFVSQYLSSIVFLSRPHREQGAEASERVSDKKVFLVIARYRKKREAKARMEEKTMQRRKVR